MNSVLPWLPTSVLVPLRPPCPRVATTPRIIASEEEESIKSLAMDYSDSDSDSTLGYSDDEDSSDEVQGTSESVYIKLYL